MTAIQIIGAALVFLSLYVARRNRKEPRVMEKASNTSTPKINPEQVA
jgi:hypothetical protein